MVKDDTFIANIARQLWNGYAVVFVGAGFSRNADSTYPMWKGLAAVYPGAIIFIAMSVIVIACAVLFRLLLIRSRWFIPVFVLANLLPAVCFNPVCLAPVKIVNHLEDLVQRTPELKYGGCFLFLGEKNFPAAAAFAAGAKVLWKHGYDKEKCVDALEEVMRIFFERIMLLISVKKCSQVTSVSRIFVPANAFSSSASPNLFLISFAI